MVKRLNLTRNQFASFLKDFEQIKQFELLFAEVNNLLNFIDSNDLLALGPPPVDGGGTTEVVSQDTLLPVSREDNSVRTDYIDFGTTAPAPFAKEGRIWWDAGEKTAVMQLGGGNVALHLGQEEYQDCYNGTGAPLAKGTVVQLTGAQGQRVRIAKAQANAEATSVHTLGFTTEAIASGAEGFVTNSGLIRGINTTVDSEGNTLAAGDTLYLSTSVAGGFTKTKPIAPNHLVIVGFVVRVHASSGSIFVKVDNGYEIDELHNVLVSSPKLAGQLLIYDATVGVWKNARLTNGTGITITNGDGTITISSNGAIPDGDKGDITVTNSGATWTIDPDAVTNAKLDNMPAGTIKGLDFDDSGAILQEDGFFLLQENGDKILGAAVASGNPKDLTGTQVTALLDVFTSALKGLAPPSGGGTTNYLRADGTWAAPPGTGTLPDGDKGDITVSNTGATWTIDAGVVSNAKLAQMAEERIKGRAVGAGTGDPQDLTPAQATAILNEFTTTVPYVKGLVPATVGGTTKYLRADGQWEVPPGTGNIPDGDKGDITTSGSGTTWTIDAGVVTNAKMAPMVQGRLKGRGATAGTGDPQDLTGTEATAILDVFTSSLKGLAPQSGGGTTNYLRADGTWANPANNAFGTVAVAGQSNVVANTPSGTLTLVAGSNVTITTNATTDAVTINASGGGGGGPSPATTVVAERTYTNALSAVGVLTTYAREDHTHGTPPALTGDVTSTSAGVTTISSNAVTTAKIANDQVTFPKMLNVTGPVLIGRSSATPGDMGVLDPESSRAILGGRILIGVTEYATAGTGTHTTSAGVKAVYVQVIGGGGGGGAGKPGTSGASVGGGGGGGAYSDVFYITSSLSLGYMVGSGGSGGVYNVSGGVGTNGTASSVTDGASTIVSAGGGFGGGSTASTDVYSFITGGAGGATGIGDVSMRGAPGGFGFTVDKSIGGISGQGGMASNGGGGGNSVTGNNGGNAGSARGGGGGGAVVTSSATDRVGGSGASGLVRIWEFY